MASSGLLPDQVKALDQLRTRLSQLSTSITLLGDHLARQDPLPPWPTLQTDATTLGSNLHDLSELLNSQRQLFTAMHAYPLPTFPASTQEMMLHGLLRKKLDPAAEDWIDSSLREEKGEEDGQAGKEVLSREEVQELCDWARGASIGVLRPLLEDDSMQDDYTLAEREEGVENIVTGIKRLDDNEDEDNDEDEDEMKVDKPVKPPSDLPQVKGMDVSRPPVLLEYILRFTSGTRGI